MFVAREKKKSNIAEYVLYMWQIEDMIRACGLDMEKIDKFIVSQYIQSPETKKEIRDWYSGLVQMMQSEQIQEKGHLQFLKNTVNDMNDLHLRLLNNPEEIKYHELNGWARANIEVLRKKSGRAGMTDIEICLDGLYGMLMLRLQKKTVSVETSEAMSTLSNLLAYLSLKYRNVELGKDEC
ncbi:MAG: DUF4924 family protein [Bacteroidota bacterium]|nr:DUF4924 family protein [Bacteroidota bacterium]